jgi:hypothetical protein
MFWFLLLGSNLFGVKVNYSYNTRPWTWCIETELVSKGKFLLEPSVLVQIFCWSKYIWVTNNISSKLIIPIKEDLKTLFTEDKGKFQRKYKVQISPHFHIKNQKYKVQIYPHFNINKHKFVQKVAKDCINKHSALNRPKPLSSLFSGPTFSLRSYRDFIQWLWQVTQRTNTPTALLLLWRL